MIDDSTIEGNKGRDARETCKMAPMHHTQISVHGETALQLLEGQADHLFHVLVRGLARALRLHPHLQSHRQAGLLAESNRAKEGSQNGL